MATPFIHRLTPVPRNQGVQVPNLWPIATWIDSVVLTGGVASSYVLPVDTATPPATGTILRLTCNSGPIYINLNVVASVPGAHIDGLSSVMCRTDLGPMLLVVPHATDTLSIFSPSNALLTIEAWS
jgi:hypothetical protein